MRYSTASAKELASRIAVAAGLPEREAEILADSLVEADIQGTSTHGLTRLNIYIRRIEKGLINPRAELTIERRRGSTIVANAGNGLGQVQASKVLAMLIPVARKSGIAAATINNSQHFGTLSYYCNKAADHNMVLFATTNVESSMAPLGGCEPFFGTNPVAASFPTGKGFHIKIDLSTSVVARGNIVAAHKMGNPIPLGWALDPEGKPTTDAERALMGTILTMAGHKGYALALLVEVLAGVLSGAAVGPLVGPMYKDFEVKQNVGHFFCLLDIEAFMGLESFIERIDAMIDAIKASKKMPGIEEILVPGERSFRTALMNRSMGIPIDDATSNELKILCEQYDVPFILKRMDVSV